MDFNKTVTMITFKHSGHAGDIIYSLPAIKAICDEMKAKATICVFINRVWEQHHDDTRQYKGLLNEQIVASLKPLIESLYFIGEFKIWEGERIAVDLDRVKQLGQSIGLPHSDIRRWYMYAFPEISSDKLHERIFHLDEIEAHCMSAGDVREFTRFEDAIVVNRTLRNLNPHINYLFLRQYKVYFLGNLSEYEMFREQVPLAEFVEAEDSLYLARVIGNSKLFIGNQSMCYSIAELMKTTRILECFGSATNVVPIGDNGYDFYTQEGLEYLTNKLMR